MMFTQAWPFRKAATGLKSHVKISKPSETSIEKDGDVWYRKSRGSNLVENLNNTINSACHRISAHHLHPLISTP